MINSILKYGLELRKMNEILINKLIRTKLDVGNEILKQLPSEKADEIRSLGKIVLKSLNEYVEQSKNDQSKPKHSAKKVKTIDIE